jgi:hypothetical protein
VAWYVRAWHVRVQLKTVSVLRIPIVRGLLKVLGYISLIQANSFVRFSE